MISSNLAGAGTPTIMPQLEYDYYEKNYQQEFKLPPLGGDMDTVTFAGFSSGSYMAHQMHIVYSDMVKGVGLHAGGPYGQHITANGIDYGTMDRAESLAKTA